VTKSLDQKPGSYGWRLSDYEGEQRLRLASAAYRGDYGKIEATAIPSSNRAHRGWFSNRNIRHMF
jgi:hypothetical protein